MKCPVDDAELRITDREGVEIDYCPVCRGVWLDRGELDKIIQRNARDIDRNDDDARDRDRDRARRPEPVRTERRDDDDDDRDRDYRDRKGKRRRSMLEDLFDFD